MTQPTEQGIDFTKFSDADLEAYEAGDSDALVDAQEQLTSVKMKLDKINNFRPAPLQQDETNV